MNDAGAEDDRGDGTPTAATPAAPDFSRAVLRDLYRYHRKRRGIALALWLATGILGGHRFYVGRTRTGLLMLFTVGGFLLWWLVDFFLLRRLVAGFNAEQARREQEGLPPLALAFMPSMDGAGLPPQPEWLERRRGRGRVLGDLLVLFLAGSGAGSLARSNGSPEAVVTIVALASITVLGARWDALARIPGLRILDRWSHRLRLYYYVNDPGGPLRLFFRPIVGLVSAPFRRRARAEAWLYLELGLAFTLLFFGLDLIEAVRIEAWNVSIDLVGLLLDALLTFVSIYAFAAPVGAILTTHVLLEDSDLVVWMLAAATFLGVFSGLSP